MVPAYRGAARESSPLSTELINGHHEIRLISEYLSEDLFVFLANPRLKFKLLDFS